MANPTRRQATLVIGGALAASPLVALGLACPGVRAAIGCHSARPARHARGRHHPGHHEAYPDRRCLSSWARTRGSPPRSPMWWPPIWSARACSSRSIRPLSSSASRHQRPAPLSGLARHQRPGPGGGTGRPRARWPLVRRVSPLGRAFGPRARAASALLSDAADWRRLGHLRRRPGLPASHGRKGYFDTQVVFIDETGPKDRRSKRLAIMDQDGANVRLLSQGRELVLTPRFSPTAQEITYMQYTGRPAARVPHEPGDRPARAAWAISRA